MSREVARTRKSTRKLSSNWSAFMHELLRYGLHLTRRLLSQTPSREKVWWRVGVWKKTWFWQVGLWLLSTTWITLDRRTLPFINEYLHCSHVLSFAILWTHTFIHCGFVENRFYREFHGEWRFPNSESLDLQWTCIRAGRSLRET